MYQPYGTAINRCIVSGRSSGRTGEEHTVFLDAVAMLFKSFDDAFNDQSDITFTLVGKPSWDHNVCFIINSTVIYLSANVAVQNTLLDAWWEEDKQNDKCLREQSVLVRMLERTVPRSEFTPINHVRPNLTNTPSVLALSAEKNLTSLISKMLNQETSRMHRFFISPAGVISMKCVKVI